MDKKDTNIKNPLKDLQNDITKRNELVDEVWRTQYLLQGLRHAISSGMKISIFDRITKVSRDGIGKITSKSINDFLDEFSEDCVPSKEIPKISTPNGDDYDNPDLSISGYGIACEDFKDRDEYRKYIRGFVGSYIIHCIHSRVCKDLFDEISILNSIKEDKRIIEYKDWVIKPTSDSFCFDMNNEDIDLLRNDLLISNLSRKYHDECARKRFEHGAETIIFFSDYDQPFKTIFEESKNYYSSKYPTNPILTEEAIMRGIETYCFNNKLSLYFKPTKRGTALNENYDDVLFELRRALNNIIKIYNSEMGD